MATFSQAQSEPLQVREVGNHTTEATTTIDAPPDQVYAMVTDYARWPELFTDVQWVKVERGPRDRARVRFRSKILNNEIVVEFDNQPGRAIHFVGVEGPRGGRANGTYLLEPIDGGRRTRVKATLYLDVVGFTGLFVSDAKVRTMRQAKLRADISDVAARASSTTSATR